MAIVVVFILLMVLSVLFHFMGQWRLPELASNWGMMDTTLMITFVICGVVYIAVILFTALAVYRYRHKEGRRAKFDPENKKLEWWLTGLTSLGIVAMLAPGLVVYADFVNVPKDAAKFEVLAQQWSWMYRFPGKDKILGTSAVKFVSFDNPFGLDPLDKHGQDDVLVNNSEVHLPIDQPIEVLLRSKDVLHNFYVPQFRAKMDIVPGIETSFWFTPTRLGKFEVLCAELCGIGHFNMRGHVVVESNDDFQQWLMDYPTFDQSMHSAAGDELSAMAQQGKQLAQSKGCIACHDFSDRPAAPSWQALFGKTRLLVNGDSIVVDEAYIKESILQPSAKIAKGYAPVMPPYQLSDLEINAIIAFIKEAGRVSGVPAVKPSNSQE